MFGSIRGLVGDMWFLVLLVALAFLAVCIISIWSIYVKMGEPGWTSLIPGYNTWLLCKHTVGKGWLMFTPAILVLINYAAYKIAPDFFGFFHFSSIITLAYGLFNTIVAWQMYRGFGKDNLLFLFIASSYLITTAIGLSRVLSAMEIVAKSVFVLELLPIVAFLICGLGDATYDDPC